MFDLLDRYFYKRMLKNPKYAYLFDEYEGDEVVSFDCETTGLDVKKDEILSIGAVKVRGNEILTSEKLELFVKPKGEIKSEAIKIHHIRKCDTHGGMSEEDAVLMLIDFIGNRPIVGYYLEFDVKMVNKSLRRVLNIGMPNKKIEVSALYYDKKVELIPQGNIDLRFDVMMEDLDIPKAGKHGAINDAIMTAMMYVKLKNTKSLRK